MWCFGFLGVFCFVLAFFGSYVSGSLWVFLFNSTELSDFCSWKVTQSQRNFYIAFILNEGFGFFLTSQVTHQRWPARPTRTWLIAWLSSWPRWCLFRRAARCLPWRSMPLIITPTPQKLSPSIPCQSWGVTIALTVLSTTLAGKMATPIQKKTNSMTQILRPISSYIL